MLSVKAFDIMQCELEDNGGYERMDDDAIVDLAQQHNSGQAADCDGRLQSLFNLAAPCFAVLPNALALVE